MQVDEKKEKKTGLAVKTTLKSLIESFIEERLQDKLDKAKDEEEATKLKKAYTPENWLTDAARRVSQIQLVTHAVKFHNPDARGSSIYLAPQQQPAENKFVSTQTLINRKNDVVGNAAALDVYKFLQLAHDNKTLLTRILDNDPELYAALPGTNLKKTEWLAAFASIAQAKGKAATHKLAKQIYFPVNNGTYHILAPMFPTSLVHSVFEQIQTRFDGSIKEARKARKQNKSHPQGYSEYVNLAVQNFGGSKPQNVSQLNSNRGGKCYLLPSFPPTWKAQGIKLPLNTKSIFTKQEINILTLNDVAHYYKTLPHTQRYLP